MSEVEHNKAMARRYINAISRTDLEDIRDCLREDAIVTSMGNTLISGASNKEDVLEKARQVTGAFAKGIQMTILNVIGEGDYVAVEAESVGTHVSGKIYNNKYHFLFRFKDGKVLEMKEYMDTEHVTDVICGGQRPTGSSAV